MSRTWRFNELLKSIDGISQNVLTDDYFKISVTVLIM